VYNDRPQQIDKARLMMLASSTNRDLVRKSDKTDSVVNKAIPLQAHIAINNEPLQPRTKRHETESPRYENMRKDFPPYREPIKKPLPPYREPLDQDTPRGESLNQDPPYRLDEDQNKQHREPLISDRKVDEPLYSVPSRRHPPNIEPSHINSAYIDTSFCDDEELEQRYLERSISKQSEFELNESYVRGMLPEELNPYTAGRSRPNFTSSQRQVQRQSSYDQRSPDHHAWSQPELYFSPHKVRGAMFIFFDNP